MSEILTFGNEILSLNGEALSLDSETPGYVVIGGKNYRTVTIGNQLWLAENLDFRFPALSYKDGINGYLNTNNTTNQAAYYNYDETTYGHEGNKYGLLYNWTAVNYIANHIVELGIPDGWHVPTKEEWEQLVNFVGDNSATKLKSTDWDSGTGTDEYNFTALPAGGWGTGFSGVGSWTRFWTSTGAENVRAYRSDISSSDSNVNITTARTYLCCSIRLVKDS